MDRFIIPSVLFVGVALIGWLLYMATAPCSEQDKQWQFISEHEGCKLYYVNCKNTRIVVCDKRQRTEYDTQEGRIKKHQSVETIEK